MKKMLVSFMVLAGCLALTAGPALQNRLQLPERIYAVPGIECNIYFENIFLTLNHANFTFEVKCKKGRCFEKCWRYIPTASEVGTYDLLLNVYDDNGLVATASSKLVVTPADAGKGKTVSLVMMGDSTLHWAHAFPTGVYNLFKTPGNPTLKMVGENGPGWPDKIGEIRHEGYGGWSFTEFTTAGRNGNKKISYQRGNPFWNPETKALDFEAYFKKNNGGKAPDFILICLGGNDVFYQTDSTIDARLDKIRKQAMFFYSVLRKAAPDTVIALILPEYCAHSQDAFGIDHGCRQIRWQFKKNFFKYRFLAMDIVAKAGDPKFLTVPCHTALDAINNVYKQKDYTNARNRTPVFRECNATHPQPCGFYQMADACYAWMKYMLANPPEAKK